VATKNKRKGLRFESTIQTLLERNGIECYKQPSSGAHRDLKDDLVLGHVEVRRYSDVHIECKTRKTMPAWLDDWLSCGIVVMRDETKGRRYWVFDEVVAVRALRALLGTAAVGDVEDLEELARHSSSLAAKLRERRAWEIPADTA